MMWCLPAEREVQVLAWADMPKAIWDSLAIIHRIAVVQCWFEEQDNVERISVVH